MASRGDDDVDDDGGLAQSCRMLEEQKVNNINATHTLCKVGHDSNRGVLIPGRNVTNDKTLE